LQIEPESKSALDLSITVPPDIAAFAPIARPYIENYFQDVIVKRKLKGTYRIDPAKWEPQYRTAAPKCAGMGLVLDGVVERAFVMVQQGETLLCIEVALGELRAGPGNLHRTISGVSA
jgi:hypothetical protein